MKWSWGIYIPLSAQVCVGDEIFLDFVDLITTLKWNFYASFHIMNAKYARRGEKAGKFVLSRTFRNLFLLVCFAVLSDNFLSLKKKNPPHSYVYLILTIFNHKKVPYE